MIKAHHKCIHFMAATAHSQFCIPDDKQFYYTMNMQIQKSKSLCGTQCSKCRKHVMLIPVDAGLWGL